MTNTATNTEPKPAQTTANYCQNCVWTVHPVMLTTYCLDSCQCERCGHVTDCAIVIKLCRPELN
jgi:hypothetical protein